MNDKVISVETVRDIAFVVIIDNSMVRLTLDEAIELHRLLSDRLYPPRRPTEDE